MSKKYILTAIDNQIASILYFIKTDIQNDEIIYNYFICEDEKGGFLDINKLLKYLTKNETKNFYLQSNIRENCKTIIDLWNDNISKNLDKIKELEEPFIFENSIRSGMTTTEFRALSLNELGEVKEYSIKKGKEFIVKQTETIILSIHSIVDKIASIEAIIIPNQPQQPAPEENENEVKKLSDLITNSKSVEIVEFIKIQYKNIKGKRLKLLFTVLQELELLPKERGLQSFYNCCKTEFDWNIASDKALYKYVFNPNIDKVEVTEMKKNIENIIQSKQVV